MSARAYLGVDLGGTQIRTVVALATDDGRPSIVARDERPTPREGGEAVVTQIVASARAAMRVAGVAVGDVVAAGCSAPGPLDHVSGVVIQTQNIARFDGMPLAARIADGLGTTVFVDRDTCMAAIGEATEGAARGAKDFVYVTVSTGVGAAIVSGGRMLRGASNTAGELGHWPVAFQTDPALAADAGIPRCGCGSFGCVESFAAGANLAAQLGVRGAEEVYAAAAAGDARASGLVVRAERALANLAVGIANGMNPELIVIGGSIAEHQPRHTIEAMRSAIAERAFRAPAAAVRLVPAALGADVGMLGAVLEARERAAGRGAWFL